MTKHDYEYAYGFDCAVIVLGVQDGLSVQRTIIFFSDEDHFNGEYSRPSEHMLVKKRDTSHNGFAQGVKISGADPEPSYSSFK